MTRTLPEDQYQNETPPAPVRLDIRADGEASVQATDWTPISDSEARSIATKEHPAPWTVEWTSFGESMGYDSLSKVLDANGRRVVTVGNGVESQICFHESVAQAIVNAANVNHDQ